MVTLPIANLTGNELVYVNPTNSGSNSLGAFQYPTTTGAIAALAAAGTSTLVFTPLTTVGAGTITASGIYNKATNRGGPQVGAAFTDTTDTAANIIALLPASDGIGTAFQYTYVNNTNAIATLTGGMGVTVSGITAVPANSWARYIVTYTAAATITMVGFEEGNFIATGTFVANSTTAVTVVNTAVTPNSSIDITLKTVGGTVGASVPVIKTISFGTGFTILALAADLSTYNYAITG